MSLTQIYALHRRPGESMKERRKLAKLLDIGELCLAATDAIENDKSTAPFGGRS